MLCFFAEQILQVVVAMRTKFLQLGFPWRDGHSTCATRSSSSRMSAERNGFTVVLLRRRRRHASAFSTSGGEDGEDPGLAGRPRFGGVTGTSLLDTISECCLLSATSRQRLRVMGFGLRARSGFLRSLLHGDVLHCHNLTILRERNKSRKFHFSSQSCHAPSCANTVLCWAFCTILAVGLLRRNLCVSSV